MTNRADVDYQTKLAHRATHVANVANAKALVEVAKQNLADAEKALKAHIAKETK